MSEIEQLRERQHDLRAMLEKMAFHGHGQDAERQALHVAYWDEIAGCERRIGELEAAEKDRQYQALKARSAELLQDEWENTRWKRKD